MKELAEKQSQEIIEYQKKLDEYNKTLSLGIQSMMKEKQKGAKIQLKKDAIPINNNKMQLPKVEKLNNDLSLK